MQIMGSELTWCEQSVFYRFRALFSALIYKCLWSRTMLFLCLTIYVRFFIYPLLLITFGHPVTDTCSSFCFLIVLIYTIYWIRDTGSPCRGGHRSNWFRSLALWKWLSQYFPARLVISEELQDWGKKNNQDVSKNGDSIQLPLSFNYLLGYHPHGGYSTGALMAYASESLNFSKMFPGIKSYLATLNMFYYVPFLRDYFMLSGCVSVNRESLFYLLDKNTTGTTGNLVAVVPGGARETLEARPGHYVLMLSRRPGFFRTALQTGSYLIPSIGFGETNLFDQVPNPEGSTLRKLQERLMRTFPIALTYSKHYIPYRRPLAVVVGCPIMCERIPNPSEEQVNELREKYKQQLIQMFNKYRPLYDPTAEDIQII
ncbi:hypothetical protein Aperf_G00000056072 [Anoplocephala perfoliata]